MTKDLLISFTNTNVWELPNRKAASSPQVHQLMRLKLTDRPSGSFYSLALNIKQESQKFEESVQHGKKSLK